MRKKCKKIILRLESAAISSILEFFELFNHDRFYDDTFDTASLTTRALF